MSNTETLPASYYVFNGTYFESTIATRGPWSLEHQHGGPPSALLARSLELEAKQSPVPMLCSRFTVLFHRPVPIEHFEIAIEPVRTGRKVRITRAHLKDAKGKIVASAEGLFMRRVPGASPETPHTRTDPAPDSGPDWMFPFCDPAVVGYHQGMHMKVLHGVHGNGKMGVWMRTRIPIVAGETPSPLQRIAIAADSGNGISAGLDFEKYTFLNPDLTVYLTREARGEWIGVDAETRFGPDGLGLASSVLLDARGVIGSGAQGLVVERR